jgi:hypothetical protein
MGVNINIGIYGMDSHIRECGPMRAVVNKMNFHVQ